MWELLQFEFARNALIAALLLGPGCALLGVLVTLRGQSFLSDALAHSAVTGVALGYLLQELIGWPADTTWTVLPFCGVLALVISVLTERSGIRPDAVITFSFAGSLALGLVILSSLDRYALLDGILFGSIFGLSVTDLWIQGGLTAATAGLFFALRRRYMLVLLQPDLARLQGIPASWLNHLLAFGVAVTVAVCIKMTGALLLSALIVIPAVTARVLAGSFRGMVAWAAGFGLVVPAAGVLLSLQRDLPTAPVMVLSLLGVLAVALGVRRVFGIGG